MKDIPEQISRTKSLLSDAKPRSHRRVELQKHLLELMVKQLRRENRQDKRRAA